MSRRVNLINNILSLVLTIAGLLAVVIVSNNSYNASIGTIIAFFAVGAVISGFICTVMHETGHLIAGKLNGFAFVSMTIWFFKWSKERGKTVFDFVMMGDESGYTEMVAKTTDNLDKRLKKMTLGGLFATLPAMVIGIIPLFFAGKLPLFGFAVLAMFLPIGAYMFFGDALPMSSGGVSNDGKILYGLKKDDDETKVSLSLLKIQSELYNGKTPAEIDEKYYFDVPQLAEDNWSFAMLLSARYEYYLDKRDYENVKKVTDRMLSIVQYFPKSYFYVAKVNELYNACTFNKDENLADDIMAELEKYLNKRNGSVEIRVKIAYILYIKGEKNSLDVFYKKGVQEANRCPLRGEGVFERKLLEEMKADF